MNEISSTFSVEPHPDYELAIQSPETDYPNYIAVVVNFTYIHVDIGKPIGILLTPPNDKKKYEIPVEVCESKIGESKHKLIIEVTD